MIYLQRAAVVVLVIAAIIAVFYFTSGDEKTNYERFRNGDLSCEYHQKYTVDELMDMSRKKAEKAEASQYVCQ